MTDPAPRYLDTSQAARYLGISPKTLMRMRVTGDGPRYAKAGRRVPGLGIGGRYGNVLDDIPGGGDAGRFRGVLEGGR